MSREELRRRIIATRRPIPVRWVEAWIAYLGPETTVDAAIAAARASTAEENVRLVNSQKIAA